MFVGFLLRLAATRCKPDLTELSARRLFIEMALAWLSLMAPGVCLVARADTAASVSITASRPGYTISEIDPAGVTVPPSYQGNDPCAVFANIVALDETPKDEFETTRQFNDRLAKNLTLPIVGNLTIQSLFAFQADPSSVSSVYDADKQEMKVTIRLARAPAPFDARSHGTLLLSESEITKQAFTAKDDFGAEFQATREGGSAVNLTVTNIKDFHLKPSPADRGDDDDYADVTLPMTPEVASSAKSHLGLLSICHLLQTQGTYVAATERRSLPTPDDPSDIDVVDMFIGARVDQLWLYNTDTGEIYLRIAAKAK